MKVIPLCYLIINILHYGCTRIMDLIYDYNLKTNSLAVIMMGIFKRKLHTYNNFLVSSGKIAWH